MATGRNGLAAGGWRYSRILTLFTLGAVLATACAAPTTPATPGTTGSAPGEAAVPTRTTPRVLRMASIREPVEGVVLFAGTGDITRQYGWIYHAGLTVYDPTTGNLTPWVARKVPSIADGDWKVAPDGSMELTWKLKPNVKWHDGTPLSAEDFVFGITVAKDPKIPLPHAANIGAVKEVLAPDAETLVVRWTEPYYSANEGTPADMPALPRHLLTDLYHQGDPTAFANSSIWTRDWVGLGPYRMGEWVPGSHLEAVAFDEYFLGRP
jgi:ABC-type transport system substrate-binding protein